MSENTKFYETLINNYYLTDNIKLKKGGPKKPKGPNYFVIILILTVIFLISLVTYNLHFIS